MSAKSQRREQDTLHSWVQPILGGRVCRPQTGAGRWPQGHMSPSSTTEKTRQEQQSTHRQVRQGSKRHEGEKREHLLAPSSGMEPRAVPGLTQAPWGSAPHPGPGQAGGTSAVDVCSPCSAVLPSPAQQELGARSTAPDTSPTLGEGWQEACHIWSVPPCPKPLCRALNPRAAITEVVALGSN